MSYIVHRGLSTHHLPSTEYRVQSTEYSKRIFAILQWFQKFRTRYLLASFALVFLSMVSFSTSFSQVLDDDCIFIVPEDTTGLSFDTLAWVPEEYFPNWYYQPFQLNGKVKHGYSMGNKMEIVLNDATFKNYYTGDAPNPKNALTGVDTK